MTLLYSGGCKFCRWTIRNVVRRLDPHRHFALIPIRHPMGQAYLDFYEVPIQQRHLNWWVIDAQGRLHAGNKGGALVVLKSLTHTQHLGRVLGVLRVEGWLNRMDDWVKNHRPLLSKYVGDGPALFRYLGQDTWLTVHKHLKEEDQWMGV